MMTEMDKKNYRKLCRSLDNSKHDVYYEKNNRETESLYRFGWFYINGYKYSISAWSFKKGQVTFEGPNEKKVKYSIVNKLTFGDNTFTKDSYLTKINKKIRNKLSKWLKDLSDKLQS